MHVEASVFLAVGIALIVVGILVVVVAIIVASARGARGGKTRAAGVIMIGPIPIIFGTDKKAVKSVLVLALALTIVLLILFVVYWWLLR
jgi:uncharacterized protein (TIGR00304 family)